MHIKTGKYENDNHIIIEDWNYLAPQETFTVSWEAVEDVDLNSLRYSTH